LAAYDLQHRELPPQVLVWEWGCPKSVETWNGRAAMIDVLLLLVIEITTGEGFYVFIMFFIFILGWL
jgi:ferrochelatase